MIETDVKPVIVSRTLKDGEKLVINGMEIEVRRKKRHERQIRLRVKYRPNLVDGLDTSENTT